MHTFDGISNRLISSFVLLLALGSLSACDDSTIVSSNLSPDDVMVNADTVFVTDVSLVRSPAFSGNRTFFTAGSVDDPVFGKLKATALLRPSISIEADVDTIGPNAVARLSLNTSNIYGSPTDPVSFEIVEIDRRWRSSSWRYDSIPDLSDRVVGQFTVSGADSVTVRLSDEWTQRYRDIFHMSTGIARDSLYRTEMPGLAIVPADENGRKMFSVEASRARLMIEGGDGLPHFSKNISSWAISLETEEFNEEAAGTSKPIYNMQGSMLKLNLELTEAFLGTNNFSRVELALYEDADRMDAGTGSQFVRPSSETMRIFNLDDEQINYAINVDPRFQTNQREDDRSFRVNLTNLAQERMAGPEDPRNLYVVVGSNDGRILPKLLAGPDDPDRQPKILITSISQDQ